MIRRFGCALEVNAPYLTRSNAAPGFGVDAALARMPDGSLYLPGSLVLGRVAEALRDLAAADPSLLEDLRDFFGAGATAEEAGDDRIGRGGRRRVFCGDFVCEQRDDPADGGKDDAHGVRTRIAIGENGVVKPGAMQVIESPFANGWRLVFRGEFRIVGPKARVESFEKRLGKALDWVSQWGALRSVGFGEASRPRRCDVEPAPRPAALETAGAERLRLTLRFKDPFFVGDRRIARNVFASSDVVPGGAIKGAIANLIIADGALSGVTSLKDLGGREGPFRPLIDHFDALRVTHAFPTKPDAPRPSRVPMSLVDAKDRFIDAAWRDDPDAPVLAKGRALSFSPDWKDKTRESACALVGWPGVEHDFRVRTAVDPDRRAAAVNRLFAMSYVRPEGLVWTAYVDLAGVPSEAREAVARALETCLADGVPGLGRGGAFALAELAREDRAPAAPPAGRLVATLQSDALIRNPAHATNDACALPAYRHAFADLGLPSGALTSIFVRERLAGAGFLARRLPGDVGYRPFLLTEAGSVFVFDADEAVAERLGRWRDRGLPPPRPTLAFYGLADAPDIWRSCPYLRENGYGEMSVADGPGSLSTTDDAEEAAA